MAEEECRRLQREVSALSSQLSEERQALEKAMVARTELEVSATLRIR